MISQFAECSGGRQWIDLHVERAKRESPLSWTNRHGHLSLSFVAPLSTLDGAISKKAAAAFSYSLDRMGFLGRSKWVRGWRSSAWVDRKSVV